jgi:hypothetical protein
MGWVRLGSGLVRGMLVGFLLWVCVGAEAGLFLGLVWVVGARK